MHWLYAQPWFALTNSNRKSIKSPTMETDDTGNNLKESLRQMTIEKLEGVVWSEPTYDSQLVVRCHELRKIPLNEFSTGDLRIMIGQQIGLPYLIPLAIEELSKNLLVEGDFYEGDLLKTCWQLTVYSGARICIYGR